MFREVKVTVLVNGYVKEERFFNIQDFQQLQDYSFALLDLHAEYGEEATYRIVEKPY